MDDLYTKTKNFKNKFSLNFIEKMDLKDYVIGYGNDNKSFCYCVENELKNLGDIHGATSLKFGIYYSKSKNVYIYAKKFGNSLEEAFENIKNELKHIITKSEKLNKFEETNSKLSPMFRYKIMYIYNPEIIVPIFSLEHCKYFCKQLNLENCNTFEDCQRGLINYKKINYSFISNHDFMRILYNDYKEVKQKNNTESKQNIIKTKEKISKNEKLFLK
ncbi:MAG: hypothetical protein J5689_03465, partial [Clostridia bacterium]|nr:hypothetical protein [Clostridia bacterium]